MIFQLGCFTVHIIYCGYDPFLAKPYHAFYVHLAIIGRSIWANIRTYGLDALGHYFIYCFVYCNS